MTQENFAVNLRRLKKVFGEKAFPTERTELILLRLQPLTDVEFARVTDDIIANETRTPTLKTFLKHAEEMLEAHKARGETALHGRLRARRMNGDACKLCDDTGSISAVDKVNRGAAMFSFGCPSDECLARGLFAPSLVKWHDQDHGERFHPCYATDSWPPHRIWKQYFDAGAGEMPPEMMNRDWRRVVEALRRGRLKVEGPND